MERDSRSSSSRWRAIVVTLALYACALGLRWIGIGHALPQSPEPDDVFAVQADFIRTHSHNPEAGSYPWMFGELTRLWPSERAQSDDTQLELARASAEPLRARWLAALVAAGIAPATWWLARGFLGDGWALIAALFSATSLFHLNFSQQGRPHAPLAALTALTLALALRARASGRARTWLAACASWVIALGTLQSAMFLAPALFTANRLRSGPRARTSVWRWCALAAAFAIAFVAFYPYLLDPAHWTRVRGDRFELGAHNLAWDRFDGSGFARLAAGLWYYDPVLTVAAAVGALAALAIARGRARARAGGGSENDWADIWILAAFAVPFVLVFGSYGGTFDRFFLPCIPLAALLAALGVRTLARSLCSFAAARAHAAIAVGASVAVLAFPIWADVRLVRLRARPDTLTLAARWIESHLDPERDHLWVNFNFELPLAYSAESLEHHRQASLTALRYFWVRRQLERAAALPRRFDIRTLPRPSAPFWTLVGTEPDRAVARLGHGYLVCVRSAEDPLGGRVDMLHHALAHHAERILSLRASYDPQSWSPAFLYDSPRFLNDLLRASSIGPVVEIFRLDPAQVTHASPR